MLNFNIIFHTIGLLFIAFAITLILPSLVAWYYADGHFDMFIYIALGSTVIGCGKKSDLYLPSNQTEPTESTEPPKNSSKSS